MSEIKYCKFCGEELEKGKTFCKFCQLDSKDFDYGIQKINYGKVKLGNRITNQARFIAIFPVAFIFIAISGSMGYVTEKSITYILCILMIIMGVFIIKKLKNDDQGEKPFVIGNLTVNTIFEVLSIIYVLQNWAANPYASIRFNFLAYLTLLGVELIVCVMYLLNVKKYNKLYQGKEN